MNQKKDELLMEWMLTWLYDTKQIHSDWQKQIGKTGFKGIKSSDIGDAEWHKKCVKEYELVIETIKVLCGTLTDR